MVNEQHGLGRHRPDEPTIFRRIDGGSGTPVCNTASGFDSRHYLKCSRGNFEPTVVLAVNDDCKLDRLSSHSPSVPLDISTKPDQDSIIKEIMNLLHYFQDPTDQQLFAKLSEIMSMAMKL